MASTDLRTAAQQMLEALEGGADSWQLVGPAIDALKVALVEDALQKFTDVSQEIEAALADPVVNQQLTTDPAEPESPERRCGGPGCDGTCCQPVQEPDLSRCPKCGGPADNGHDRGVPPNPYFCTKCTGEPHGCDHCSHPLYAAIKCRVCGRGKA